MSDEPKDNQFKDSQLDALLESLLSEYSAADPRPGLETRIVATLREAARKRSWLGNLRWVWAGAAAAGITVFILFFFSRTLLPPQPEVVRRVEPVPSLTNLRPRQGRQKSVAIQPGPFNSPDKAEASVRGDVFPTPVPLSEQERLLLRYVAGTPRDEIMAQSRADPEKSAPEESGESPRDMTQVLQRTIDTR